jgi:hypothetical protein
MKVLNVGNGNSRHLPPHFEGWDQVTLDIDATVNPDIVLDAKEIINLPANEYDAVYSSHILEHVYKHEVSNVLKGFLHVLKVGGFMESLVPNLQELFRAILKNGLDINDVWYRSTGTPITFHDVLYGWGPALEGGNLYYAHKCGFTPISLWYMVDRTGFKQVETQERDGNLYVKGVKQCQ